MKSQTCSSIILMLLLIVLISITSSEATRILNYNNEKVDFLKGAKYLLLQSLQWRPVGPPTPNPGTNVPNQITSQVTQRNFAGCKEFAHPPPPPPYNDYPQTKIAFGVAMD
ncbi:hypothetical protein MTR67_040726 [Solanum verrucosum]|uniref:Uncharacterized protein n=1 Tax=Solanum verrucosum TaxID=315347 RepID=A0AAF0ZQ25_SOLVR|nr:hypothetical protein MTR67_040726 [Solanum verrucosum]